jgi:hypothetical protein
MMVGVGFLLRVTLRRLDLTEAIFYVREPKLIPPVMSPKEIKRLLAMTHGLKAQAALSLAYGCGLVIAGICFTMQQNRADYSITSSARSKIDCGAVRPSALAVLRFRAISYFVGNCTGRSPGFSPRRMRST